MYNKKDLINQTDKLWQNYKNVFEQTDRKRKHSLKILHAVLYVDKTGCQWRMLPENFPKWQLVYCCFRKWKREGVFDEILECVRNRLRKNFGKKNIAKRWNN